jgi:hypothetical protein
MELVSVAATLSATIGVTVDDLWSVDVTGVSLEMTGVASFFCIDSSGVVSLGLVGKVATEAAAAAAATVVAVVFGVADALVFGLGLVVFFAAVVGFAG